MNFKKIIKFILCLALPLALGSIGGIVTAPNIKTWYQFLNKPFFNPPNYLFAPVWTTLYLLMGISLYLILELPKTKPRQKAIYLFCGQMILNFAWSFIFFQFKLIGLALVEIILMWTFIFLMIKSYFSLNKWAAYLQFPYLLWVSFASILNASIFWLNF
jgi:translocator protein